MIDYWVDKVYHFGNYSFHHIGNCSIQSHGRYMKGKRQSTVEPVFGSQDPIPGHAQDKYHRNQSGQQGLCTFRQSTIT